MIHFCLPTRARRRAQELTAARKAANVAAPRQSALPDPLSAMASASGASAKFLNPEATKQINRLDHVQAQRPRGEYSMPASAGESGGEAKVTLSRRPIALTCPPIPAASFDRPSPTSHLQKDAKGPGFDIASLVPKHPSGPQKRQGSQVAAEAKRAKTAMEMHAEAIGGASALAIGALGGQSREGERERGKGRGAAAMPVEDFLANAGGSLPRQKKDR